MSRYGSTWSNPKSNIPRRPEILPAVKSTLNSLDSLRKAYKAGDFKRVAANDLPESLEALESLPPDKKGALARNNVVLFRLVVFKRKHDFGIFDGGCEPGRWPTGRRTMIWVEFHRYGGREWTLFAGTGPKGTFFEAPCKGREPAAKLGLAMASFIRSVASRLPSPRVRSTALPLPGRELRQAIARRKQDRGLSGAPRRRTRLERLRSGT